MNLRISLAATAALTLAACVPATQPPAPPPPAPPRQEPRPPQPPAPPPASSDWRDIALTPGNWFYSGLTAAGSQAGYGAANSEAQFTIRCDRARRQIVLTREGVPTSAAMTIRTSYTARTLPASIQREPMQSVSAALAATDPILDSIAFSRGRFTVEVPGLPMLVIPAWAEPARVIEDCRR